MACLMGERKPSPVQGLGRCPFRGTWWAAILLVNPGLEVGPQHHVGTSSGPPRKVLGLGQYQENSQGKAQGPAED